MGLLGVGEIEPRGLEVLLEFRKIGGIAHLRETDHVRRVAGEDADDGLFFAFRLRRSLEEFATNVAIHRQPVFHIVSDETQSFRRRRSRGNGSGFQRILNLRWLVRGKGIRLDRNWIRRGRWSFPAGSVPIRRAVFFVAGGTGEQRGGTKNSPKNSWGWISRQSAKSEQSEESHGNQDSRGSLPGTSFTRVSVSERVISCSNSSFAFLNSPMLLPIPRASSGNFFAPKSNKIMMQIIIISCIPIGPMVLVVLVLLRNCNRVR